MEKLQLVAASPTDQKFAVITKLSQEKTVEGSAVTMERTFGGVLTQAQLVDLEQKIHALLAA